MNIRFEELRSEQRLGGIESATKSLQEQLSLAGLNVSRSSEVRGNHVRRPDCVHIHGIWSPTLAKQSVVWRRNKVPVLVSSHGMLQPWALAHKPLKKKIAWHVYQRFLLNRSNAIHATSEREANQIRTLGVQSPVTTIPWGISIPQIAVEKRQSSQEGRVALFVGRLYPVKGLPMLVEAWARVRPAGWRMKIVGPNEAGHRAEIETQIKSAGLESVFDFAGELTGEAKEQAFRDADLFILPTHSENFGIAIGEALAHGLPVITTQGAPWELLQTERCGWWTPVSIDGLAEALAQATALSSETLAEMGARGRIVVAERFAWSAVAKQFIQVYEWIAHGGAKPQCVL